MRDYISSIFDTFKVKTESAESKNDIDNLISVLSDLDAEFDQKVLAGAAGFLPINPTADYDNDEDNTNPVPSAIFKIKEAIEQAIDYCNLLKQDPLATEDAELDIPEIPGDISSEISNELEAPVALEEDNMPSDSSEVRIIDEWEYLKNDPEFDGNSTLLYDKGSFVVFIQKDSDLENPAPYYVQTAGFELNQEHQESDFETLCKWLEVNEYPVPTQEAKDVFLGIVESINEKAEETSHDKAMKELCKSAPKDFKCAKDDPEIGRVAKKVDDPAKGHVDKDLEDTDIK